MAKSIVSSQSTPSQTHRARLVIDALRHAADAAAAGNEAMLVTMLSAAIYNLPEPLKPALGPALLAPGPEIWRKYGAL